MRRHVVVKPAWRARIADPRRQRNKMNIGVNVETHATIHREAAKVGMSGRRWADAVINRALDREERR